ncbi:MAG: hypothetical protein E6H08_22415 [Bacteroidetes bacterium]|nr:MAG: hypothetical protein E6H08_22415 [Bacteroidota bacterium]
MGRTAEGRSRNTFSFTRITHQQGIIAGLLRYVNENLKKEKPQRNEPLAVTAKGINADFTKKFNQISLPREQSANRNAFYEIKQDIQKANPIILQKNFAITPRNDFKSERPIHKVTLEKFSENNIPQQTQKRPSQLRRMKVNLQAA